MCTQAAATEGQYASGCNNIYLLTCESLACIGHSLMVIFDQNLCFNLLLKYFPFYPGDVF